MSTPLFAADAKRNSDEAIARNNRRNREQLLSEIAPNIFELIEQQSNKGVISLSYSVPPSSVNLFSRAMEYYGYRVDVPEYDPLDQFVDVVIGWS